MIIGLTGGIGSGKTTIARTLETLGYPVYYTDAEAKRIIVENPAVRSQIEYLFGSDVYDGDVYRTDVVAKQVFADRQLLEKLNKVVHPAVRFDLRHWAKKQLQNTPSIEDNTPTSTSPTKSESPTSPIESDSKTPSSQLVFVECAILWESGMAEECDLIADITAPLEVRISRTMARDNISREQVLKRINAQMSEEERIARANIILCNDGTLSPSQLALSLLEKIGKNGL